MKPWSVANTETRIVRPLRATGQLDQDVNVLMLWGEAMPKGSGCATSMTYRQALGGQVRNGETGSMIVYVNRIARTEADDNGDAVERQIPFLKGHTVFNVEQVDGLDGRFYGLPSPPLPLESRIAAAEAFAAFGHMLVPRDLWRAMQRYTVWVEPALVAEWMRLMRAYAARQGRTLEEGRLARATTWSDPDRDVGVARSIALRQLEERKTSVASGRVGGWSRAPWISTTACRGQPGLAAIYGT